MAVYDDMYGTTEESYVGCVIDTYERNGYEDSDFYAVCWDEDRQQVVHVEYDTTRCACNGYAKIDASEEVIRKVFRFYFNQAREEFDRRGNEAQAKKVHKGDTIMVIRGRKTPKGTVGTCFWVGESLNRYTFKYEQRVGIEFDGNKVFLPLEYVEVMDWKNKLIHGKERKLRIHKAAVNSMPIQYRELF